MNNWLDKLERKFSRYAIPNLITYIIILYAAGFALELINPTFYSQFLSLDASKILQGQIWRIVTFIIQPPSNSLIFIAFALYLYYMIGKQLEAAWGAFRFNLYFFSGMLFIVLGAILAYLLTGTVLPMDTWYLNLSLFFAFAALYPDIQLLLFFVIPIKIKWLAILDGLYFIYAIVQAFLPAYGGGVFGIYYKANALAAFISILNFIIFFLSSRNMKPYTPGQMKRKNDFKRKMRHAERPVNSYANGAKHRCAVCGRTELDDPNLEFRYCYVMAIMNIARTICSHIHMLNNQERNRRNMKKTKIICTMGPNTNDETLMRKLVQNGMDIARFNFSHGDHEEQKGRMDMLKKIREEENKPIAILLDTKGPEIRTGVLKDGKKVQLEAGETFTLTTDEIVGDNKIVSITYKGLVEDVKAGSTILIDDGLIELKVKDKKGNNINCEIVNGGELGEKKGVNVPNVAIRLPAITDKDRDDLKFGVEQGVDFIAASFVRNAECILEIKSFLRECKAPYIPVIAKIENFEAIKNIDEIIRCADGIMVARGDLGVEIPAEEVPYLQKTIIQKCNDNFKPVITATQMLDSMMRNPRPTRAEVTDVANAVYDGTDAVMLSGETAQGKYPLEALQMMVHIVENTEEHLDYDMILRKAGEHRLKSASSALANATVTTANNLRAKCIVTPTVSGATARVVSKFKPKTGIIGISPDEATLRRMQINWGVMPLKSVAVYTTEDICDTAIDLICAKKLAEAGDMVVLTLGIPSTNVSENRTVSNMMRIAMVDDRK